MGMGAKLAFTGALLLGAGTASAGFVIPTGYLKTHNLPYAAATYRPLDILADDVYGTFVQYGTSRFSMVGELPGGADVNLFRWQNFGSTTVVNLTTDLGCHDIEIEYDENSCSAGLSEVECCSPECWWNVVYGNSVVAMDMAVSGERLISASLVNYYDDPMEGYHRRIYLQEFNPSTGAKVGDPFIFHERTFADHYNINGDWIHPGAIITDVSIARDNTTAAGNFLVSWIEVDLCAEQFYLKMRRLGDAPSATVSHALGWSDVYYYDLKVDSVYDIQSGNIFLATDAMSGGARVVIPWRRASGTGAVTQGNSFSNAKHPTIAAYPWTSAQDFAVTHVKVSGSSVAGVALQRGVWSGSSMSSTAIDVVNTTSAELPSIATFKHAGSSPPSVSEVVMWATGPFAGGQGMMAYFREGSTVPEAVNIPVARTEGGHSSSTNGNYQPQVAAPPSTTNVAGLYTVWFGEDSAGTRVHGKKASSVPFKQRWVASWAALQSQTDVDTLLCVSTWYNWVPVGALNLLNCGVIATHHEGRQGKYEYPITSWDNGDQLFLSPVVYSITGRSPNSGTNQPAIKLGYVNDHTEYPLGTMVEFAEHSPAASGTYTSPNTNNASDYYWNFWSQHPTFTEQVGVYIPNPNISSWQYSATLSGSSTLKLYYIDWVP